MSSTILKPAGTVSYHEPSLPHLLTLISFIYLLNFARTIADTVLGAGLLGEIAIGVVYGPVAKILETEWQDTFLAIGYIGLVLIVFEGGLTLDLRSFVPLLPLALVSALAGILLPLAFTFALFSAPSFGYPPIQAFTAGSALASTSLGTTFFVLKSAGQGLDATRIAQVLKGAALVDDIIALVLLSVISSLAGDEGTSLGWTIGRPIVASVAMCLVSPLVILYVLRPFFKLRKVATWVDRGGKAVKLFLGVAVLSAYLAIAYYAGTTVLLGAFLAGVTLPFLSPSSSTSSSPTFEQVYEHYLVPLQTYLLVPFFFGSIGYSIPFLELWKGRIIWKGIVYSILMTLGKILVGVTVVVNDGLFGGRGKEREGEGGRGGELEEKEEGKGTRNVSNTFAERSRPFSTPTPTLSTSSTTVVEDDTKRQNDRKQSFVKETLPAASFLGLALIARGEIGILVLQVAYNANTSSSNASSSVLSTEPYLVAIWAVLICTIVGPVGFARLVKIREGTGPWDGA
ncbi:hypothetical protein JCM16303_007004 [Sporobolomyces ruberrimus]